MEFNLRNWIPLRDPSYTPDLYIEVEIDPTEDPDCIPCSATPTGPDESWILRFGVYYAMGDFDLAKQHANMQVTTTLPSGQQESRALWTARVKRFSDGRTVYEVGQKAGKETKAA